MVIEWVSFSVGGAVAAVVSPAVYAFVKTKIVQPAEAKWAALEAKVAAIDAVVKTAAKSV
jgi:hypothetical protein